MPQSLRDIRTSILRTLLAVAMIVCGVGQSWGADYVIYQDGYYLCMDGTSLSATDTFNPSTCIWTCSGTESSGSNSGTLKNGVYFLYQSTGNNTSCSASTDQSTDWTISNNKLYFSYKSSNKGFKLYYYYFTVSSSGTTAVRNTSNNSTSLIYSITSSGSISGDETISTTGSHDYSSSWTYSSNAFSSDQTVSDPSSDITWSVSTPSGASVSINSSTGELTVNSITSDCTATITATYAGTSVTKSVSLETPKDPHNITVTQPASGGEISASATSALPGTTVTLTVTPATGKILSSLSVKDASNADVTVSRYPYQFTMPNSDVTVSATFVDGFADGDLVVIQNAQDKTKYIASPSANSAVSMQDQYGATPFTLVANGTSFWLKENVTGTDWWMGYPTSTTAGVNMVSTTVKNNGWAGIYFITQQGSTYQFADTNTKNTASNKYLTLYNSTAAGSTGTTTASQWIIHPVTAYSVIVTGATAGSITYSGTNLYGAAQTQNNGGTYYFEGTPTVDAFVGNTIENYTVGTVVLDNSAKTVTLNYTPKCATPTISGNENTYTLSCSNPTSGVTIYYTTDDSTPSATNGTGVTSGTSITVEYNKTIKAIAIASGYDDSDIASYLVSEHSSGSGTEADPYIITNASQLNDMADLITSNASACFKVTANITASSYTPSSTAFTGTFDGGLYTISRLDQALFSSVSGGTVKNVILDNVSISGSGNRGAIANEASGASRIYNCGVLATGSTFEFDKTYTSSSTVTSTDACAGSIVGVISDNTRVLNCYSYADVSGSTYGAGIVGRSTGTWINTTTVQSTQCFVMNCMFYGNVVSGNTKSPIVNASTNTSYSMYSYFRYKSISSVSSMTQNGALAIQEDIWLKRFAFFQAAVTNHRDLAALYCFNDATRISEIAQWYIDESIAPWPILRKAEAQKSTLNRTIPSTGNANEGNLITNAPSDVTKRYNMNVGSSGYLTVNYTISDGTVSTSSSVQLPITDMDYDHYDYTWGKVVLPFINEFDAWRDATNKDYGKVCIGWEITGMTGGTTGTLTDYNYADRNCTAKDIYDSSTNPLLYAQGGNFIVPYGVTAININAHFATAYYLSDASYDCTASGGTTRGTRPTTYHGETVYNTAAAAWAAMTETTSPNDQAIVLVGNYHYTSNTSGSHTGKGCTVLSVDEDNDQQPDYGWYSSVTNYRQYWPSMRWDFVPIIGAGMAQINSGSMPPGLAIPVATGWWEMTETTLCRTFEFEISDNHRTNEDNGYGNNCYIINGGWFQQLVRCWDGTCNRLSYVKVGGNAYIKEFFHGNHSSQSRQWTVRPINVTGGEIPSCFMTGMGNKNVISTTNNNIRFYCAGGKIDKYLSVYMEYPVVDATMKVDHAYINRFFGGGTTGKAQLTGNIDITMDHSDVTFFCGGPEFGDMASDKTVTINTTGSTFGEFYGAGFGGTALTRNLNTEGSSGMSAINNYSSCYLQYNASKGGVGVSYEMEALLNGSGTALYRFYDYYAALSLATTGSVTTKATNCLFKNSFYGGGCQGKVNGTISSTLTDCDVTESVFGGGYKASSTTIDVYPTTTPTYPTFDTTYKAFSDMGYPASTEYTWISGTSTGTVSGTTIQSGLTEDESKTLGQVTDNISIIVQSSATGAATVGGSVFGGGNESSSLKNTEVKILGNTSVTGSVYGGGNEATVGGTTTVQIGDECE